MTFFPNETLEIWTLTDGDTYDPYTDSQTQKYVLEKTIRVDFQNVSPKESMAEFGEITQDTYKIYTNEHIPKTSILRIKGKTPTFTITGTTQINNHFRLTSHKKIYVTKEREPHKLDTNYN